MSNFLNLPNLNLPNLPFQLPGGWTLMPPPIMGGSGATSAAQQPSTTLPPLTFPGLPQGGQLPDLSGLVSALTPVITAAFPQIAPFLPIVGVLFNILHSLSTQMQATAASGNQNQSLQMVHDAAWAQVLSVFAPQAATAPAAG